MERDSPFPQGCWAVKGRRMLLPALTKWSSMQWRMPLGLCPGSSPHQWLWHTAGASSGTSAGHLLAWVTLSLTASLASLPTVAAVATKPVAFPCHDTWSSAPPVLPKACTNTASLWGTLQSHVSVTTVLAQQLVRGDLDLPGYPPIRASLPQEDWGTTLASSAPGVCVHAADLPASLYSLQCVVGTSQSQHHQPGSIMAQLLGSWEELLVRPGWDRNSLAGLDTRPTPELTGDKVTGRTSGHWHNQAFNYLSQELHRWVFQTVLKIPHGISCFA